MFFKGIERMLKEDQVAQRQYFKESSKTKMPCHLKFLLSSQQKTILSHNPRCRQYYIPAHHIFAQEFPYSQVSPYPFLPLSKS